MKFSVEDLAALRALNSATPAEKNDDTAMRRLFPPSILSSVPGSCSSRRRYSYRDDEPRLGPFESQAGAARARPKGVATLKARSPLACHVSRLLRHRFWGQVFFDSKWTTYSNAGL